MILYEAKEIVPEPSDDRPFGGSSRCDPFWDDLSVAAAGGAGTVSFKGTDETGANVALGRSCRRAGIERFTTRAFRQAFAARAGKVAAPGSIHCLTGHVSDAMPNAVYRRAAALNPS